MFVAVNLLRQFRILLLPMLLLAALPSCKLLFPNNMFRQKDYQFFELAQKTVDEYIIQSNDQLTVQLFTRDGFKLVDAIGGNSGIQAAQVQLVGLQYLVDAEGFVNLPILGEMYVKGYTESQLETILADKYSSLYVDPYVVVTVINRRVFLFKGSNSSIIPLNQAPTTILEVIAKAGGIPDNFKAYNIKVIRGDLKNPQVTIIDLSTLEGLRKSDLIVQSNDIIYLDFRYNVPNAILSPLVPYISLLTTVSTLIVLITTLAK
jgi:polysaccharide export outer membrane protein